MWRHQSTARPLERSASHIKVTCPPCLFRLPPWENVNRPTTLIYHMWWRVISLIIHERLHNFVDALFPTLSWMDIDTFVLLSLILRWGLTQVRLPTLTGLQNVCTISCSQVVSLTAREEGWNKTWCCGCCISPTLSIYIFSFVFCRVHWVRPFRLWKYYSRGNDGPKVWTIWAQLTHPQWCGLLQQNHCNVWGSLHLWW